MDLSCNVGRRERAVLRHVLQPPRPGESDPVAQHPQDIPDHILLSEREVDSRIDLRFLERAFLQEFVRKRTFFVLAHTFSIIFSHPPLQKMKNFL